MKIANFKANSYSSLKVFKPIQYLTIDGCAHNQQIENVKLRVRVVNSETGRVDEIIPMITLDVLGEIASMNEGFFMLQDNKADNQLYFRINVMLHPTSAIYLSNDKYLELDIEGLDEDYSTTIYGIEKPVIDKEFVCRYNKFYMSAGELQKTFAVGENENLVLPYLSFEEVTIHYKNGSSCTYTTDELSAMMMMQNDIVSVPVLHEHSSNFSAYPYWANVYGHSKMYGLDVSDAVDFTIRRESSTSAFELIMIDTLKD